MIKPPDYSLSGDQVVDVSKTLELYNCEQDLVQLQQNLNLYITLRLASYDQSVNLQDESIEFISKNDNMLHSFVEKSRHPISHHYPTEYRISLMLI